MSLCEPSSTSPRIEEQSGNPGREYRPTRRIAANLDDRLNEAQRELGIEVGEFVSAPRDIPSQGFAERGGLNGNEQEALLGREVLVAGCAQLMRGGEVDEAVAQIIGRAREDARLRGLVPFLPPHDLEDHDLVRTPLSAESRDRSLQARGTRHAHSFLATLSASLPAPSSPLHRHRAASP